MTMERAATNCRSVQPDPRSPFVHILSLAMSTVVAADTSDMPLTGLSQMPCEVVSGWDNLCEICFLSIDWRKSLPLFEPRASMRSLFLGLFRVKM